jgi:MFS family permease
MRLAARTPGDPREVGLSRTARVSLVYLAIGLTNAAEAVEVLSAGYLLERVTDNDSARTAVAVGVYVGMLIGGLTSGILSDRFGRAIVLRWSVAIAAAAATASAVVPNLPLMVLCRLASGGGVGAATPPLFSLAVELAPPGRAATAVSIVASFWMVGSLFAAGAALAILGPTADDPPTWSASASWRRFALVCASLPLVSTALCFACVRDSTIEVLTAPRARISSSGGGGDGAEAPSSLQIAEVVLLPQREAWWSVCSRLVLRRGSPMLPLMLAWFGLNFGYYGMATWVTVLLGKSFAGGDTYSMALLYASANLPGNIVSVLLIERVGKQPLLAAAMALSTCAAIGLGLAEISPDGHAALIVALAVAFNACATAGWNSLDALSASSFEAPVRGTALGMLTATGRVADIAAQIVNGVLIDASTPALLAVTSTCMGLGAVGAICTSRTPNGD